MLFISKSRDFKNKIEQPARNISPSGVILANLWLQKLLIVNVQADKADRCLIHAEPISGA